MKQQTKNQIYWWIERWAPCTCGLGLWCLGAWAILRIKDKEEQ